jgi:hypothetical protein
MPRLTCGVMSLSFVSSGNCRWLSTVSARKMNAATAVLPIAKRLA